MYKSMRSAKRIVADFRSDTVTTPTKEMLNAMMNAPVGDDVFSEDPTINLLEDTVAKLAGKEAGLFCCSGTMANQLAIRTHLIQPPYSVILDHRAHVDIYEAGGIAFHTGARVIPLRPIDMFLTAKEIEKALVLDDDVHHTPTKLVCLENTLNGNVMPLHFIQEIADLTRKHAIPLHCDGARLWNAMVKEKSELVDWTRHFDSVSLCFSKGLGAPVGSVLVGSLQFIKKARHFRKMYGGGWRQAGGLANACLYALEHHLPRLHRDHELADYLGKEIQKLGFSLSKPVETNMVWINTGDFCCQDFADQLDKHGIKVFGGNDKEMRLVIHHQISQENVELLLNTVREMKHSKAD